MVETTPGIADVKARIEQAIIACPPDPTTDSLNVWLLHAPDSVAATVALAVQVPQVRALFKTLAEKQWARLGSKKSSPQVLWADLQKIFAGLVPLSDRSDAAFDRHYEKRHAKHGRLGADESYQKETTRRQLLRYGDEPWQESVADYLAQTRQPLCCRDDMFSPPGQVPKEPEPSLDGQDASDSMAFAPIPPEFIEHRRPSWDYRSPPLGDFLIVHVMRKLADTVQAALELSEMAREIGLKTDPRRCSRLTQRLEAIKEAFWYSKGTEVHPCAVGLLQVYLAGFRTRSKLSAFGIETSRSSADLAGAIAAHIRQFPPVEVARWVIAALHKLLEAMAPIAGAAKEAGAESGAFALDKRDQIILAALAKTVIATGREKIATQAANTFGFDISEKTIGGRLTRLIEHGLADRPLGPRKGFVITDKGRKAIEPFLQTLTPKQANTSKTVP